MSEIDNVPQNEEEVDQLLGSIEEPKDESSIEPGAETKQVNTAAEDYMLKVGGKEIKATRDQVLRWAQQGYDSPNKIGELNKQLQSWSQKEAQWKAQEAQIKEWKEKYESVDNYVKQNPKWWETVQSSYEQVKSQNQAVDPRVDSLKQEIDNLKQITDSYKEREQAQLMKLEDEKYNEAFNNLQKQYPKIDFVTPDSQGKSLEYKVLEFAQKEGIKEFATAFKAFHHDELMKMAQEDAKLKVISDKNTKSKLGILGISSTPTPRVTDSVKGKSYNDIQAEILREYGIS